MSFISPENFAPFFIRVLLGILFFGQGFEKVFRIKIANVIATIQPSYSKLRIPSFIIIAGAYITLIGAGITLLINWLFIPYFSYMACAWATFACYGSMMVVSYIWGQKEYRIPYATKKLVAYMVIVVTLFFIHKGAIWLYQPQWFSLVIATLFLALFTRFILLVEKKEFQKFPVVGKYI